MVPSSKRPVIAFMTDFGWADGDVGVMKGVALTIAPDAQIVDITHAIAPQNVPSAAWTLGVRYAYFPKGTVFICVVDPGVGSSRHPIAIHAGDWFFVGPDNGVFTYVLSEQPVHKVVQTSNPDYHLPQVSTTFHGRDIFAPVGAHIANGVELAEMGPGRDSASLKRLEDGLAVRKGNFINAQIIHVDNFGNLVTNIPLSMIPDLFTSGGVQLTFTKEGIVINERRSFFAEGVDDGADESNPFIYTDSSGFLGVAVRNGNATKRLAIGDGAGVVVEIQAT